MKKINIQYRATPKFPEYLIGEDGTIFSNKAAVNRYLKCTKEWYKNKKGGRAKKRVRVALWTGGNYIRFSVHNVVAEAFLPARPSLFHTIDHIDRNPFNNHRTNLRWATKAEQAKNRISQRVIKRKVTMEELNEIYNRTKTETVPDVAKDVGIYHNHLYTLLKYMHPDY